jgi:hypothetical protein
LNYGQIMTAEERQNIKLAAEPKLLFELDYMKIRELLTPAPMTAEWHMPDISNVAAVMVYGTAQYAPGMVLDSIGSDTWVIEKYGFVPFAVKEGTLRFTAKFDPRAPQWSVDVPSHPSLAAQTFAPFFGFSRAKMALASASFKRARRRKT